LKLLTKKKERIKKELIESRKAYLASTDWYAARLSKRQIPIPQKIIEKDILCAQEIDDIENCETLEELNEFSLTFEKRLDK